MNSIFKKYRNLKEAIVQFIKFGIVGMSNTAISYGIEMLCYYILFVDVFKTEGAKIIITTAIAFTVSVTNSYFWNSRYVFKVGEKTFVQHLYSYIKTFISYALTGLILSPLFKIALSKVNIEYWLSCILSLIITIPINFLLNKFWSFRKNKNEEGAN